MNKTCSVNELRLSFSVFSGFHFKRKESAVGFCIMNPVEAWIFYKTLRKRPKLWKSVPLPVCPFLPSTNDTFLWRKVKSLDFPFIVPVYFRLTSFREKLLLATLNKSTFETTRRDWAAERFHSEFSFCSGVKHPIGGKTMKRSCQVWGAHLPAYLSH